MTNNCVHPIKSQQTEYAQGWLLSAVFGLDNDNSGAQDNGEMMRWWGHCQLHFNYDGDRICREAALRCHTSHCVTLSRVTCQATGSNDPVLEDLQV